MKRTRLYLILISMFLLLSFSTGVFAADAKLGEEKAAQCASCHGVNGEGNGEPNTKLSGMDVGKFSKSIKDYKSGARKHAMMEMFAKKLSDEDVTNLAAFYAAK